MKEWIKKIETHPYYQGIFLGGIVIGLLLIVMGYQKINRPAQLFTSQETLVNDLQDVSYEEATDQIEQEEVEVTVEIKGSVAHPGVYTLPYNSRVIDLVTTAGGLTAEAYADHLNQAQKLEDQMMIYVYNQQEYQSLIEQTEMTNELTAFPSIQGADKKDDQLIDINTDHTEELLTLPGIGVKKAEAIQTYRKEHGNFKQIEELMEVSGIGEKTFDGLKELITVTP